MAASNPEIFIYGLADPDTKKVRYVGATMNPKRRRYVHKPSRGGYNDAKTAWLKDLAARGKQPELVILEATNNEQAGIREAFWIRHYIREGDLCNRPTKRVLQGGKTDYDRWRNSPQKKVFKAEQDLVMLIRCGGE